MAQLLLQNYTLITSEYDTKSFVWGSNSYTAAKFYNFAFAQVQCDVGFNSIWKSKCLPKLKVFLWLLYYDRLNTLDLMTRKHWQVEGFSYY